MKNFVKTFAALLAVLALPPAAARSETFKMAQFPDHEKRVTEIHYEGKKIDPETATLSQKLLWLGSPRRLESDLHWAGNGPSRHREYVMVERLNNKNTAVNTYSFKPGNMLILDKYERVETSPSGRRLRRDFYYVGHGGNNFPEDTMHTYALELAFRGMDLNKPGTRRGYTLWLPPAMLIPMEVRVRGRETIETPIGARECHKVEIAPNMSKFLGSILGRIVQPLIPKYQFWFDVNGARPLLKYKGPLGKFNIIGVPDEVYETESIDPDPSK